MSNVSMSSIVMAIVLLLWLAYAVLVAVWVVQQS